MSMLVNDCAPIVAKKKQIYLFTDDAQSCYTHGREDENCAVTQ